VSLVTLANYFVLLPWELFDWITYSTTDHSPEARVSKPHRKMTLPTVPADDQGGDLLSLWERGDLADVYLRCAGGELVPAHRVVLAASSPFFRALFVGTGRRMREGSSSEIDLPLAAPELRLLLKAVYKNAAGADLRADTVEQLLSAASYLSVGPITDACCDFLRRHLDMSTCVPTLLLAERYGCQGLRDDAVSKLPDAPGPCTWLPCDPPKEGTVVWRHHWLDL
jgi:hypothetical protein